MKKNDNLPTIIATIALIIFIVGFALIISRPKKDEPLESGNIEKAIQTEQYR